MSQANTKYIDLVIRAKDESAGVFSKAASNAASFAEKVQAQQQARGQFGFSSGVFADWAKATEEREAKRVAIIKAAADRETAIRQQAAEKRRQIEERAARDEQREANAASKRTEAMLKGAGAAGIFTFAAARLNTALDKMAEIEEKVADGSLSVAEGADAMTRAFAGAIPVFGGFFEAGQKIRAMMDGTAQEMADLARSQEIADLWFKNQKKSADDLTASLEKLQKRVTDMRSADERAGLKGSAAAMFDQRKKNADNEADIVAEAKAARKQIEDDNAALIAAARKAEADIRGRALDEAKQRASAGAARYGLSEDQTLPQEIQRSLAKRQGELAAAGLAVKAAADKKAEQLAKIDAAEKQALAQASQNAKAALDRVGKEQVEAQNKRIDAWVKAVTDKIDEAKNGIAKFYSEVEKAYDERENKLDDLRRKREVNELEAQGKHFDALRMNMVLENEKLIREAESRGDEDMIVAISNLMESAEAAIDKQEGAALRRAKDSLIDFFDFEDDNKKPKKAGSNTSPVTSGVLSNRFQNFAAVQGGSVDAKILETVQRSAKAAEETATATKRTADYFAQIIQRGPTSGGGFALNSGLA